MSDFCKKCQEAHAFEDWIFQKDAKSRAGISKRCRAWKNFKKQSRYINFLEYKAQVLQKIKNRKICAKLRKRVYDELRRQNLSPEARELLRQRQLAWTRTSKGRGAIRKANAKRYSTSEGAMASRIRAQINMRLRNPSVSGSFRYLPYSPQELKQHLENHFKNGMSWENRHLWDIDHIVPLKFKHSDGTYYWNQQELTDPTSETFKKAWSLENLQPLWRRENAQKSNKSIF